MKPILLLFDIDGTLLSGHGVPKQAAMEVMRRNYPNYKPNGIFHFAGLTDPQIFKEILMLYGVTDPTPERVDFLIAEFIETLRKKVTDEDPPHVLGGVRSLLERCQAQDNCYLGLVTGNVKDGAFIKLRTAGLYSYFVTGAFGDDNHDRNCLPPIAIKRMERYYQLKFSSVNTWIIGDSARDVECALKSGLQCLAVETGLASADELKNAGATYLVKNLLNTDKIMALFNQAGK